MTLMNVLVVGAGPTGLIQAISLTRLGIKVRIIDKAETNVAQSRALIMQSRTLELYQLLDLTGEMLERGHKLQAVNIWTEGNRKAKIPFGDFGSETTAYPFVFILPQHIQEPILERKLNSMGVFVERRTELLDFVDHESHITARVRRPDNSEETFDAAYIIGCDGAHSTVRHGIKTGFTGAPYMQTFYVADLEGSGTIVNGEAHLALGGKQVINAISYENNSRMHLIGAVSGTGAAQSDMDFEDIRPRIENALDLKVNTVHWFTTYRVHHRVAEKFRDGRAFIAGDAAHILSPIAGQGMNTGIADAINLSWKMASVLQGKATNALLCTYQSERRTFALQLVKTTDQVFTMMMDEGFLTATIREWITTLIFPLGSPAPGAGSFFFQVVSQLQRNYRDSPLAGGGEGDIQGGDRLPFVDNNHASFSDLRWRVHVYGTAGEDLARWCQAKKIDLHNFSWEEEFRKVGLLPDTIYLIRPDTYIALSVPAGQVERLEQYLADRELKL